MTHEPDPFDQLLATALRARPERQPMTSIAAAAIARAQLHRQRTTNLARISLWTRFCSTAAILLVVATIAVAYYEWPTSTTSTTTSEVATSTDTTTSTTTSSSSPDMTTIGAGAFLLALLAVASLMVLTPERPTWRLTPA